ncbi:helical backbone metal receptor [Angustibacter luteus]|uniref:Helical backbone metal receptor n=1 Tax=Angustibacter luteus TaxID=658456 RepID=A0ABW1JBW7_9ACTN
MRDDTGVAARLPATVRRVVSLVPSLTEAVEVSAPGLVVGATAWCTHPTGLDVARIGGTKNPDVEAVVALGPDLVLANEEENRAVDLDALRSAGVPVWNTRVRTLDEAFGSLNQMLRVCGVGDPGWLLAAREAWDAVDVLTTGQERPRRAAVVPIWRRPWMALGADTFAGDVLRRLGVDNVLADSAERYPRFVPGELTSHDLVVLPDEPYAFGVDDGPEAFAGKDCVLVSGRHLTWYGPSLVEAAGVLRRQLESPVRAP